MAPGCGAPVRQLLGDLHRRGRAAGHRGAQGVDGPPLVRRRDVRREAVRVGQRPVQAVDVVLVLQVVQDGARAQGGHDGRQQADALAVDAAHDVVGAELVGVHQAGGLQQLLERVQRVGVVLRHARALSATTSARWRSGSCVVMPVGQRLWQPAPGCSPAPS
jgi:hypothetical protein